jgi:hypothetical protein
MIDEVVDLGHPPHSGESQEDIGLDIAKDIDE